MGRLKSSRNWQSFRGARNQPKRAQRLSHVARPCTTRGEVGENTIGGTVKRPETNVQQAKRVKMDQRRIAILSRQNNNRNVRKKTIAIRLAQRPPPVVQFD